jgi:hypothetical protein
MRLCGGDPVRQFFAQIRCPDVANRSKTSALPVLARIML